MTDEFGEILTRWTVRIAVGCYLARFVVKIADQRGSRGEFLARWLWTTGLVFYLAHVVCAFQFFHHWSHAAAYKHTAQQTREVVGIDWGGGIYVNYLFTLLWLADNFLWWSRGENYLRCKGTLFWTLQTFFAFIVFNATVVFGPPFWKWTLLIAGVVFSMFRWKRR